MCIHAHSQLEQYMYPNCVVNARHYRGTRPNMTAYLCMMEDSKIEAERLQERSDAQILSDTIKLDGAVYFHKWEMDCDCASSDTAHKFTSYRQWLRFKYDRELNAEGPVRIMQISADEYEKFKPSSRDHALEAFEDGHPHSIHI
tara:strand:+ start:152 stop:583 length:432 start_codon:yes stop_codon:yes gene_type:complete